MNECSHRSTPAALAAFLTLATAGIFAQSATDPADQAPEPPQKRQQVPAAALAQLEEQIREMADRWQSSSETGDLPNLDRALRSQLEVYFDSELTLRESELNKLEQRVRILRQQLDRRRAAKEQILAQQLELLTSESGTDIERDPFSSNTSSAISDDDQQTRDITMGLISNLKNLALSILIYRDEHGDSLPENLADLPGQRTPGPPFHDADELVAAITQHSSLIYLKMSDEMLASLRKSIGHQPPPEAIIPVVLVPWKGSMLVASLDATVHQVRLKERNPLEKLLKILTQRHGPLESFIVADDEAAASHFDWLTQTLEEADITFTDTREQLLSEKLVTLRIQPRSTPAANADEHPVLKEGHWYNFYFKEGRSPFTSATAVNERARSSLTIHAVKVVETKDGWAKIKHPAKTSEHVAIIAARAKDHTNHGEATVQGPAFKEWEKSVTQWLSIWVKLADVTRISEMD